MEVPRLGLNRSYRCWPTPQPQQYRIWAASAAYTTDHGNARSLTYWARPGIKPAFSWMLVRFVSVVPQWELWDYFPLMVIIRYWISSLCYTVNPWCLSILCIVVYICYSHTPNLSLPLSLSPLVTISLFSMSVFLFCV